MRRISRIRSKREAELEKQREELRNLRWARRRSMVTTAVIASSALVITRTDEWEAMLDVVREVSGL